MIAKNKLIEAVDFDNDLKSLEAERTLTNTQTIPAEAQYNYKARSVQTRSGSSYTLYTTSNIQDSGGTVSNSEESGPTKDLVTVSDFKSSIATKASSSHSHSLSDVREFAGWSITQNSSKDIVFKVLSPAKWNIVYESKFDSHNNIYGICYGNGKFVAVGASGKMTYSPDGVNWTTVTNSRFGDLNISSVCYGNGKFVAVGRNGKIHYCR